MSRPKKLSGFDLVKILCNEFGFVARRQKGSHVILIREDQNGKTGCVIPLHDELKTGTLKGILKQAHITEEELSNRR